jgi:hypothetical protein
MTFFYSIRSYFFIYAPNYTCFSCFSLNYLQNHKNGVQLRNYLTHGQVFQIVTIIPDLFSTLSVMGV